MLANIRKRLALLPPTLLGIGVLIFALTRFLPGGQSERRPVQESQLSAILGLSDPGTQRSWDSALMRPDSAPSTWLGPIVILTLTTVISEATRKAIYPQDEQVSTGQSPAPKGAGL